MKANTPAEVPADNIRNQNYREKINDSKSRIASSMFVMQNARVCLLLIPSVNENKKVISIETVFLGN